MFMNSASGVIFYTFLLGKGSSTSEPCPRRRNWPNRYDVIPETGSSNQLIQILMPNPKKNMMYGTLCRTITSPYVHSRIDSNTFTMCNPMPVSTLFPSQRLRIWPLSAFNIHVKDTDIRTSQMINDDITVYSSLFASSF
jgi:hypothetical protein